MPLRVLMISSFFYPAVGGLEKQALLLARALKEEGVHTTVLTRRLPRMPDREVIDDIAVIRLGSYERGFQWSVLSALAWSRVCWQVRDHFDVFHAHQPSSSALVAGLIGRLTNKPSLCKVPCTESAKWLEVRAVRGRLLSGLLDCVVVVNAESQQILSKSSVWQSKVRQISNGIELRTNVPEKMPTARYGHTVLCVGRLVPKNGIDVLITAWSSVLGCLPEAMLIIVGGGREQSKLERQAEEASIRASVRFVGETHPSRVDAFYEEADLFVKPSWSEGVSNAVLEAIVHRVPVVASRIPGNVDVIQHEESGLLFDPGSAMALAEAIVDSLTNRATARLRAERAYQRVAEEFDIRQVAKEYLKLYEALLEQHARGKPATASRG